MHGMEVHRSVLAAGETESGATVHLVEADYDSGDIICQRKVPVSPNDTPETLAKRVEGIEGSLLVEAISNTAIMLRRRAATRHSSSQL
jgi:phosphoribosylglycinamide formyltransferase-1